MPKAYYNEFDPYAAEWLRNLIAAGHVAPGEVDQRSIEDVAPLDLAGFTQCHFFAGIGVWSLALRRAGWPDSRPVWTGSCPCQPFSAAGKGNGFDDERHLWPSWFHLISQRGPVVIFGEQVSSKDADIWVDLVQTDMEAMGYAFGAVPFPSAGIGAPHIRDRLYWLADSCNERCDGIDSRIRGRRSQQNSVETDWRGEAVRNGRFLSARELSEVPYSGKYVDPDRLDHADREPTVNAVRAGRDVYGGASDTLQPTGPVNGRWSDADWLFCRDGKWRPVEPGTFPLANGAPARVGRLRAYGNAINAEAAEAVIRAYMECRP